MAAMTASQPKAGPSEPQRPVTNAKKARTSGTLSARRIDEPVCGGASRDSSGSSGSNRDVSGCVRVPAVVVPVAGPKSVTAPVIAEVPNSVFEKENGSSTQRVYGRAACGARSGESGWPRVGLHG